MSFGILELVIIFLVGLFVLVLFGGIIFLLVRSTRQASAVPQGGLKKCPYCAEYIKNEAVVCRYCGRDQPPAAG